jgi:hypothetical protein
VDREAISIKKMTLKNVINNCNLKSSVVKKWVNCVRKGIIPQEKGGRPRVIYEEGIFDAEFRLVADGMTDNTIVDEVLREEHVNTIHRRRINYEETGFERLSQQVKYRYRLKVMKVVHEN